MFSFLTGSGTPRDAPAAAPEASTRSSARMSAVSVEGSVSQNPRRLTKRRSKGKMSISPVARAERSVRPSLRNSLVVPEETIFEEAPQSVVAMNNESSPARMNLPVGPYAVAQWCPMAAHYLPKPMLIAG